MTYNPNLEEDIKLWLASPEDLFFQQSIYLPLLNYVAGILLRLNPTASQDDALTYLSDIVARLPKYDAGKGCTVLSFVRHNVQWMYGERLNKTICNEKLAKFQSIYNNEGTINEEIAGYTDFTSSIEREDEYTEKLRKLESIINSNFSSNKHYKYGQYAFEQQLLNILRNKGNNQYDNRTAYADAGLCGCVMPTKFKYKTTNLLMVKRKVKRIIKTNE